MKISKIIAVYSSCYFILLFSNRASSQVFISPDSVKSYVVKYLFNNDSLSYKSLDFKYFLRNIITKNYLGDKISIYAFSSNTTPIHSFILIITEKKQVKSYKVLGEFDHLDSDLGYLFILMDKYKFTNKQKVMLYDYLASSAFLKEMEN